jgi:16S rRNA (cytosine1402-N4)-methyltransferase
MSLGEEKDSSAASRQHVAVMVEEVVALVRASNPLTVLDVTVGMGGHAAALLEATHAHLLGLDRDSSVLGAAAERLRSYGTRVTLRHADFRDLEAVLDECGIPCVGAVVADLGMSTFALDDPQRGFSFRLDGPLDMRMDRDQSLRAYDLVNEESEPALARIIYEFGEERASRRIARAIVEARRRRPIETTGQLCAIIESVTGGRRQHGIHPATRTFQALRIAVNQELDSLAALLESAPRRLAAVWSHLLIIRSKIA